MPTYRTGTVSEILGARRGLQRVSVELGDDRGPERAYVLTQLVGEVAPGDRVVVNTTAVDLGLGTGGWHFVHWNLERAEFHAPGPGHIMKLRYTSLQADVGSTEEHHPELAGITSIHGLPVVAASLHSQLPGIAVAIRHAEPSARIAYVMTDAAALPLALSDLVANLSDAALIDTTITSGHAFGGEHEAVSLHSALAIAEHVARADVAIVAMGPGVVGTGTRLGYSGIEMGPILDATIGLGGTAVACLRASTADPRERHRGVSHHTTTALTVACRGGALVALPTVGGETEALLRAHLADAGVDAHHEMVAVEPLDIVAAFAAQGLDVRSMGRRAEDDPVLHQCAAAAGTVAAQRLRRPLRRDVAEPRR